jgi:hypothetical protein
MVVGWSYCNTNGGEYDTCGLKFRLINSDRSIGPEVTLIPDRPFDFTGMEIVALAGGRFMVMWGELTTAGGSLQGQIFNANGTPAAAKFRIDQTDGLSESSPVATILPDGSVAIAWVETNAAGASIIKARVITSSGATVGNEIVVSDFTGDNIAPTIVSHGDGRFTVSWTNFQDGIGNYIRSQTFDSRINDDWTGTDWHDRRVGTISADTLSGGGGNDHLVGHDGHDRLDGGSGADTLVGGDGQDRLFGSSDNDSIYGGIGNDELGGGADSDLLHGGAGRDRVDYESAFERVIIDFANQALNDGAAKGDTLVEIEEVLGSSLNDSLVGGNGSYSLYGNDGQDILSDGGDAGDTLYGGAGNDLYYVSGSSTVVEDGGFGENDQVIASSHYKLGEAAGIEVLSAADNGFNINLTGNSSANQIWGNTGQNKLEGRDGGDTLKGGAGSDTLYGGKGADVLDGGTGIDWADYSLADSGVVVDLTNGGLNTGEAAGDRLIGIQHLRGRTIKTPLRGTMPPTILRAARGMTSSTAEAARAPIPLTAAPAGILQLTSSPPQMSASRSILPIGITMRARRRAMSSSTSAAMWGRTRLTRWSATGAKSSAPGAATIRLWVEAEMTPCSAMTTTI